MLLLESIAEQEMGTAGFMLQCQKHINVTTPFQNSWPLKTLIIHPKSIGESASRQRVSNAVIDEIDANICKLISLFFLYSLSLSLAQQKAYNIKQQSG